MRVLDHGEQRPVARRRLEHAADRPGGLAGLRRLVGPAERAEHALGDHADAVVVRELLADPRLGVLAGDAAEELPSGRADVVPAGSAWQRAA